MINYITGGLEYVDTIEDIWNGLRTFHGKCSTYFGDEMLSVAYNQRKQSFYVDKKQIFIIIAKDNDKNIGYCVASFIQDKGEIESIYVNSDYRGQKIGSMLMNKSLNWLNDNGIEKIEIYVAVGNESAYKFYEQFGFFPRVTKLVKKYII